MKNNKFILLILYLVFSSAISLADHKEINFDFLLDVGTQTGVLTQDKNGFIWIGTQDGIVKNHPLMA